MHCLAISKIMAIQIDPYMHIYMHVLINATDYTCIYMITKESGEGTIVRVEREKWACFSQIGMQTV